MSSDFQLILNFWLSIMSDIVSLVTSFWLLGVSIFGLFVLRKFVNTFKKI